MNEKTMNGVEVTARLIDGTEEKVLVKHIKLSQAQQYIAFSQSGDDCGLIALVTGKDKDWADKLAHESVGEIAYADEGLNLEFATRCARRAEERREKLTPGFQQQALDALINRMAPKLENILPKAAK